MRAWLCAAGVVLPLLGGCETLDSTYVDEVNDLINENGVYVYAEHTIDGWDGSGWDQFKAQNNSSDPICVTVNLKDGSSTSGHSMGEVYKLAPGNSADIGYVQDPSNFSVGARAWSPDENDVCGSPPS